MPRGSCVFYSGRTFHGSGENRSGTTRQALNFACEHRSRVHLTSALFLFFCTSAFGLANLPVL